MIVNIYKLPVTYEMYGIVEVEASSLKNAIKYFDDNIDDVDLPYDPYYIKGSFDLSTRDIDELAIYQN